jgi:hypothetical protein
LLATAGLFGATVALGATSSPSTGPPLPDLNSGAGRQAFERGQQEAAQAQAYRDSARGRDERAASRAAYRNQPDDQALATARAKFSQLVDAPAEKLPNLRPGEQVDRYLGSQTAIISEPGNQKAVLESNLPLQGQKPDGSTAPLDMALSDRGDSFAPKSTLRSVRIPKRSGGEVQFSDQGIGISVPARGGDAKLSSNNAFFANAFQDGDLVVRPSPFGAEISLVLRSPASPSNPALTFNLPPDAHLQLARPSESDPVPLGSAEVVRGGHRIALIDPAAAIDAQGQSIAVRYRVEGDRLVMEVDEGGDVAWPVMVDPTTYVYDNNGQSAGAGTPGYNWPGWIPVTNRPTTSPPTPGCPYPSAAPFYECLSSGALYVWAFTQSQSQSAFSQYVGFDYGAWRKRARSGTYIWRLDAANMSHYTSSDNKSASFAGICTTNCAAWQSGYWWTPRDTTTTGTPDQGPPNQGGSTALRANGAAIRSQTEYYCVDPNPVPKQSCAFGASANNPNVQTNNTAEWGMLMTPGWPATQPYAALGGAATLSADNVPPDIVSASHSSPPSTSWVESYSDTVTLRAADNHAGIDNNYTVGSNLNVNGDHLTGVGLGQVSVSGPTPPGQSPPAPQVANCTTTTNYDTCPQVLTFPGIPYGAPEGNSTYTPTATDIVGNSNNGPAWTVKVDNSPPSTLNLSGGTLTGQDGQRVNGSYTLNFAAADQYSGVKQARLYVDDLANPVDTRTQLPACDTSGCPNTLSGQFSIDTNALNPDGSYRYSEGYHTIQVSAEDPLASAGGSTANHVRSQSFQVLIDRTVPSPDTGGELDWARDESRLTTDHPDLQVSASDGNDAGTASSGVKSIEVKFDGVDNNPAVQLVQQQCATDSCTLDHTFQLDTSQLADGTHTVDILVTDFAGNVNDQSWTFTIDRHTPLPLCSDPSADPNGCQADPPSTTPPTCLPGVVAPQPQAGAFVTGAQAVAAIQQSAPDVLAVSDTTSNEGLTIAPALTSGLLGYTSTQIAEPSTIGASFATTTVGAGTRGVCIAPTTTTVAAPQPVLVNNAAVVFADTAPSSDTILRPTPFGVQELRQIRDASAPEAVSYQISLQPGQYLQQLDSGAVAVIDPSIPSVSGSLPPYDQGTPPTDSGPDPVDTSPAHGSDPTQDTAPIPDGSVDAVLPDDPSISPRETQFQYDNQTGLLREADQIADGQEVAVISPPFATDASGTDVPTDLAVTGPSTVTVTTHHQSAPYAYPVTSSQKYMTTKASRRPKVISGLGITKGSDLFAAKSQAPGQTGPAEGAPMLRAKQRVTLTRFNLYDEAACHDWDGPGKDITQPRRSRRTTTPIPRTTRHGTAVSASSTS